MFFFYYDDGYTNCVGLSFDYKSCRPIYKIYFNFIYGVYNCYIIYDSCYTNDICLTIRNKSKESRSLFLVNK